jgi:hypothetical protein
MRRGLRVFALVSGGAFALHELQYLFELGGDWQAVFAAPGHDYFSLVIPVVVLALAAAAILFLAEFAGGRSDGARSGQRPSLGLTWTAFALALAGIYLGQELLEEVFAGHEASMSHVLGTESWSVWALAVAIGGLLALLHCGADAARAPLPAALRLRWAALVMSARRPPATARPPRHPLACHLSARAPPAT